MTATITGPEADWTRANGSSRDWVLLVQSQLMQAATAAVRPDEPAVHENVVAASTISSRAAKKARESAAEERPPKKKAKKTARKAKKAKKDGSSVLSVGSRCVQRNVGEAVAACSAPVHSNRPLQSTDGYLVLRSRACCRGKTEPL